MNKSFISKTIALRGKTKGEVWLESIPLLVKEFEQKWNLEVEPPFPNSYVNYVAPAKRVDGQEVVIKIGYPTDNEFQSEVASLKVFNGRGVVKLLDEDLAKGILLLEKLIPGKSASEIEDDEEATKIIANLMPKIWKQVPQDYNFQPLFTFTRDFDWYRKKYSNNGPLPRELVEKGAELRMKLVKPKENWYLLHGDLHHENTLSTDGGYKAIDPKGVVGQREYEVAAALRNPYEKLVKMPNLKQVLEKRINIFVEILGLDRQKIIDWSIAQTVLSCIWSLKENDTHWTNWIQIAEVLSTIK